MRFDFGNDNNRYARTSKSIEHHTVTDTRYSKCVDWSSLEKKGIADKRSKTAAVTVVQSAQGDKYLSSFYLFY